MMMFRHSAALLLAATMLSEAPAFAQDSDLAAEIAALRAQLGALEARLADIEQAPGGTGQPPLAAAAPDPAPAATAEAAPAPSWRGAPQFSAPGGGSFKPRGRIQYDAGHVSRLDGIVDPGLGFANRLRRGRLGFEGTMPGGFGYRAEVDFAGPSVEVTDLYLSYRAAEGLDLILGQHNNFQGLERQSSSLFSSFIERAAFTTAFNLERRVGLSATLARGDLTVEGGVFTDAIADLADGTRGSGLGDENRAVSFDGRLVYAPEIGGTRLHFGGSVHLRDQSQQAESGVTTRYRQRPFLRTWNTRFIGTPPLRVEGEDHYGLEAAAIRGPFHAAAEVHWLHADTLGSAPSPTFFGGYAELGYFLTGESRGYRAGKFDRTRVADPLSEGGAGAFQINLRFDHLDLDDSGVQGGRQAGYMASLIWIPEDHVRFLLNYARLDYENATLLGAGARRDYGVDVIGARAQIDF